MSRCPDNASDLGVRIDDATHLGACNLSVEYSSTLSIAVAASGPRIKAPVAMAFRVGLSR